MRREIIDVVADVNDCCPGHDVYPNDTYRNNRSKAARSRDIGKEHRHARRVKKHHLAVLVKNTRPEHLSPLWDYVVPVGKEIW